MRMAAHVLAFDVNDVLPAMIDNIGPHVERIYVAHSELPWTYNPSARDQFRNPTDPSIVDQCKYRDKVVVIHGLWDSDEDQRNACAEQAAADGFDILLVQDADEFVFSEEVEHALNVIRKHPEVDLFRCHWITFWKSTEYALVDPNGSQLSGTPEYAINLNHGIRFVDRRTTNAVSELQLDLICYHLSQVGSDRRVFAKISTWSHSHEMNPRRWYKYKWQRWNPDVKFLHPVRPTNWLRAAPYQGPLPAPLIDWPHNNGSQYRENILERFTRLARDNSTPVRLRLGKYIRGFRRWIRRVVR